MILHSRVGDILPCYGLVEIGYQTTPDEKALVLSIGLGNLSAAN